MSALEKETQGKVSSLLDSQQLAVLSTQREGQPVVESERPLYEKLYLQRHPYLEEFLTSPTTAIIKIRVSHYVLVSRFQEVMEYSIRDECNLIS